MFLHNFVIEELANAYEINFKEAQMGQMQEHAIEPTQGVFGENSSVAELHFRSP